MTDDTIHTCSYSCERPGCIRAQRDELVAKVEALRAEVERLRADRDSWEQQASDRVADWHAEHLRAERLAEALEQCITSMLDSGYRTDAVVIRAARAALAAQQQGGAS